mgnify:CR=1 FL=1
MKKTLLLASLAMMVAVITGCKEEKKSNIIITQKPKPIKPKATQKMGDYEQTMKVSWLDNSYTIEVATKYFDNIIRLRVVRADGTTFYSHTFSKKDFNSCLTEQYRKNGALLGIVYVKCDDNYLYFAASVGSPDKSSDEYIPLVLKLHRLGSIQITKDTQLDTADDVDIEDADDDGV